LTGVYTPVMIKVIDDSGGCFAMNTTINTKKFTVTALLTALAILIPFVVVLISISTLITGGTWKRED
jgi:hypothetical protein